MLALLELNNGAFAASNVILTLTADTTHKIHTFHTLKIRKNLILLVMQIIKLLLSYS